MTNIRGANNIACAWIALTTTLLLMFSGSRMAMSQDTKEDLPIVAIAEVPFYPTTARVAHVEGTVKLRVSTDGEHVRDVTVDSGPPLLLDATKRNIKTWRFKTHSAATFEVAFRYKILSGSQCYADNGTVTLRLPREVEVNAKGVETCDPASNSTAKK